MQEIDNMDMIGYLRVRAWKAGREKEKKASVRRFIDEVLPTLSPS